MQLAIEALGHELPPGENDPIAALLVSATEERRAREYLGIRSRINQLSAFAHHDFGKTPTYSRAEAQFVTRITESFIALIGHLTATKGDR